MANLSHIPGAFPLAALSETGSGAVDTELEGQLEPKLVPPPRANCTLGACGGADTGEGNPMLSFLFDVFVVSKVEAACSVPRTDVGAPKMKF